MSRLVAFPEQIESIPDADLLDLSVSVEAGHTRAPSVVHAKARYATSATVHQVQEFYVDQFARCGATMSKPVSLGGGYRVIVDAVLNGSTETSYRVSVDQVRGYRSVKIEVSYPGFDHRELFERFACWHDGEAPITSICEPSGLEISTFASGRRPNTLVLYSTHYDCSETSRQARRAMVDDRIDELGWTYREPREGIMFIQDGVFDAETHVMGDDSSSSVTFVGEFQLR